MHYGHSAADPVEAGDFEPDRPAVGVFFLRTKGMAAGPQVTTFVTTVPDSGFAGFAGFAGQAAVKNPCAACFSQQNQWRPRPELNRGKRFYRPSRAVSCDSRR